MRILITVCAVCLIAGPASAADECQLYFQFTTTSGSMGSNILDLDQGEARPVQQPRIRYIQNKKSHPIKIEITNLWPPYGRKWVTLTSSGAQDPPSGTYGGSVTLFNVECGGGSVENVPQQFAQLAASSLTQATGAVGAISLEMAFAGFTGGYHAIPNATPTQAFPLQRGPNQLTLRGLGLMAVNTIGGVPQGSVVQIAGRGAANIGPTVWDYLHVTINVPNGAVLGSAGTARLMVNGNQGPTFRWIVQQPQVATTQPPPGGNVRNPGAARPDLVPIPFVGSLYKVGTATTMDANNGTFTALEPFTGSVFCQGISEGSFNRSNMPTSNAQSITVPDIRWGVQNSSSVDVTATFTIRLTHGRQQVASQTVNGLGAGQTREFIYQRPQSQTTVARVGAGNGCYHVGLGSQGWNDNAGYSVQVDSGQSVNESSEGNNVRGL